jgi:hypothetical protein
LQRATTDAQIDTSNLLPAATETFFWQPNTKNERLCKFIGQATKDMIGFSIAMSVTLFPPLIIPAASAQIVQYSLPWAGWALGNALRNPWIATSLQMFPGSVGPPSFRLHSSYVTNRNIYSTLVQGSIKAVTAFCQLLLTSGLKG